MSRDFRNDNIDYGDIIFDLNMYSNKYIFQKNIFIILKLLYLQI